MSEGKRPRGIKLELTGSLVQSAPVADAVAVKIKGQAGGGTTAAKGAAGKIGGRVKLRRESKGRGGKSVVVLFEFTDGEAQNSESLKALAAHLKEKLACGGTVESGQIVIQSDNMDRVLLVLGQVGIQGQKAGG